MSGRNSTRITHGEGEYRDTIHVQRLRSSEPSSAFLTPKLPLAALSTSPSSSGGMEDISLTSPSVGESVKQVASKTPKRTQAPYVPERTLSSAVRRLVAKPGPSKGSANDPILLEEYSPPRGKPLPVPKCQERWQEPQKFQNRHRKMDKPLPARRALAAKPTNGSTFTGNKGNDMYKMMHAKAAVVDWMPPVPQSRVGYGVPFEIQYPKSAQFLVKQPAPVTQYQFPYAHYHTNMGVSLSGDSEDMLRKGALQQIRETSRPQPHKKMLWDDADETSASETEAPRTGKKLHVYQDPNDHITPLVSQTCLLTSLLQVYPRSTDQKGLRDDISMLVNVQNRGVIEWMKSEAKKNQRYSAVVVDERARKAVDRLLVEQREQSKRDEQVRSLLSAQAGIWRDGSGEGVVDVFAVEGRDEVDKGGRAEAGVKRKVEVCGWDMVE